MRKVGWLKLHLSERTLRAGLADAEKVRSYNIPHNVLDAAALASIEPCLSGVSGAIHFCDAGVVSDPGVLTKKYAELFFLRGGRFLGGDATTLDQARKGWVVSGRPCAVAGWEVAVALGPWSDDVFKRFGYRLPFAVKRGYHMHYQATDSASLNHPVLDADYGFCIAPMQQGIRLTTGAEFSRRDAKLHLRQIKQREEIARRLFPFGQACESVPWTGSRPCLLDMLSIGSRAPDTRALVQLWSSSWLHPWSSVRSIARSTYDRQRRVHGSNPVLGKEIFVKEDPVACYTARRRKYIASVQTTLNDPRVARGVNLIG